MKIQDEQSQCFRAVFELHYNALCNYACSFLKDVAASEDVVQEVFIKIWENRKDLIASDSIRFYLFTAVRNNCLTCLQKDKKGIIVPLNAQDGSEEPNHYSIDHSSSTDYKDLLKQALDELPPRCREVFLLSRFSKQSYQEIADSLDLSVKTVEGQIGKALKILRAFAKKNKTGVF